MLWIVSPLVRSSANTAAGKVIITRRIRCVERGVCPIVGHVTVTLAIYQVSAL